MRIENRSGDQIAEATVLVDDSELVDLLEGIADVVEGNRSHLHFAQQGGPQLVIRRASGEDDPIGRSMDWWVGPLVLIGVLLVIVGAITLLRWAAGLVI